MNHTKIHEPLGVHTSFFPFVVTKMKRKSLFSTCFLFPFNRVINPSSPKEGATTPKQFWNRCSQTQSQKVKLPQVPLSSSFPLFLTKKNRAYHLHRGKVSFQSWEVGWCNPVILKLDYFENIWSDMHSKLCVQLRIAIFLRIKQKTKTKQNKTKKTKKPMFLRFLTHKSIFAYILHINCQFLKFRWRAQLWRHSEDWGHTLMVVTYFGITGKRISIPIHW